MRGDGDFPINLNPNSTDQKVKQAKSDGWNGGKTYLKNMLTAEIEWIREGLVKGFPINEFTILDYLQKKVEDYSKDTSSDTTIYHT